MPRSYEPHCTQSWESRISSVRYCNAINSTLFEKCRAKVDPKYYFNACKLDMCECPGDQCHCEVLTAYARECERAGMMVHNWRESTGCKNVTSFRYSGVTNHISKEDHDDDSDVESVVKNDVMIPSDIDELAVPKLMTTSDLGDYLPACRPETADQCGLAETGVPEKSRNKKEKKKQKLKEAKKERRQKRKKERKEKERLKREEG